MGGCIRSGYRNKDDFLGASLTLLVLSPGFGRYVRRGLMLPVGRKGRLASGAEIGRLLLFSECAIDLIR
jgi:hypothetical protein